MTLVKPDLISGTQVRAEWSGLIRADTLLLDGVSAVELAGQRFARFRSFVFDAGFVPLRNGIPDHPRDHVVYRRSALLTDPALSGSAGPDSVAMPKLGHHDSGRFANQLWQYLFVRMYGLRNFLTVRVPAWEGEQLFGMQDLRPDGSDRPCMQYSAFSVEPLKLWETDDAPRNVDLRGFFQCVPPQWAAHRSFIRNLYTLKPQWRGATERLGRLLKSEGRTLVTIHVRRGDYRKAQYVDPYFRLVPIEWYLALLDQIWPRIERPVLHVSTDEPAVAAAFAKYERLDATFFLRDFGIPEHVRDFVLLQEADYLVASNSSFSTMAAVVGKPGQKGFLADFRVGTFTPYDPWSEPIFASRFLTEPRTVGSDGRSGSGARRRIIMRQLITRYHDLTHQMYRLSFAFGVRSKSETPVRRLAYRVRQAVRSRYP